MVTAKGVFPAAGTTQSCFVLLNHKYLWVPLLCLRAWHKVHGGILAAALS